MKTKAPTWELLEKYSELENGAIAGVDEVGRGCLAGPVVAAAVILPPRLLIDGVNDSKLVTAAARRRLDREIRRQALAIGVGWVASSELDEYGLSWAVKQSGLRALAGLEQAVDLVVLDGNHNYLQATQRSVTIIRADSLIVPVAAASIVAKVARDRYMERLARKYPHYGFELHKGYGTAIHLAALDCFGASMQHRRSFKTVGRLAV